MSIALLHCSMAPPAHAADAELAGWVGPVALALFVLAYLLVAVEEFTHLRKSKPVMLAAGVIWAIIAGASGGSETVAAALEEVLVEYAELLLFLLAAMTYVNAMTERNVFGALRAWLIRSGFGYRQLFLITGGLAFTLSPFLDNLTTALVLCAVALALGAGQPRFVGLACINIVVAANAGGVFSPFGDITSLMVWQAGHLQFVEFFPLFLPSLVNFAVPAALMYAAVPNGRPAAADETEKLKRGAVVVVILFGLTLVTAVGFHSLLHLPPFLGMMTGLAYLKFFGYYLGRVAARENSDPDQIGDVTAFDVFRYVARAEWDTLLFFYGVVLCVGGLGYIGYLAAASELMYGVWGATAANIGVGLLSAVVDNIPIMVAVLEMRPEMSIGQWQLVTLTTGVGGSLLSIGSAAGVALMGQARGVYTFVSHLRWMPVIAAGLAASILVHLWLNGARL